MSPRPRTPAPRSARVSSRTMQLMRALLALPVVALACGQFLGDVDIETEPRTLQPDDAPGATSLDAGVGDVVGDGIDEPSCEPGATRCDDGALQVCVRFDATRPPGWLTQVDCGSAELCKDGPPATCAPSGHSAARRAVSVSLYTSPSPRD